MLADDWEQIKLVFEAAINLPAAERAAYVEGKCAGEPQHRAIISELLDNHDGAGQFLETVKVRIRNVFAEKELVASRFRIVRLIGDGGMGEVYEAFDERLRVRVALKTLRSELTSDPEALERFRREILVAREVSHDNLCKIFDWVEHSDASSHSVVPCLTMQLIEGESLLKHLQTRRPLSPQEALPLIRQVACAIDALHAHEIVHRDLKPSNIMITTRNGVLCAVVTDFGLAKLVLPKDAGFFESQVEFQAGAPYFMAPELLRDGRPSPASDIYALGLIMDEMVTATRAFPAESLHSLYYQKLWETPIRPTARSSRLEPLWDRVILKCLALEPFDRYHRAYEAVAELDRGIAQASKAEVSASPASGAETSQTAPRRGTFRFLTPSRWAGFALFALAILSTAAILGHFVSTPLKTSVVVFPIEDLTNRADLSYLSKGIAAEVMRRLTLIDGIQVIPYYESRAKTLTSELKGQFSLAGLLQISDSRVRLTVQLTENRDGSLVWSQGVEGDMKNPLQLQSEIAEGAVQALQRRALFGKSPAINTAGMLIPGPLLKLFGFQRAVVPRAATENATAFYYYSRGLQLFDEQTVPASLDAIRSYERALQEDPGFALAASALADVQFILLNYEYEPTPTLVARARRYAEQAIRLDPDLAEPYAALASVQQSDWDLAGAEQSFKTAIRLNPKFARGHRWYAGLLMQYARFDESLAEVRRSMELDPYDYPAQTNYGLFLSYARRFREAQAAFEETLRHKDLISAHRDLGDLYVYLALQNKGKAAAGYFKQALREADIVEAAIRRTLQSLPPSSVVSIKYADRMHAATYKLSGDAAAAEPYLERLRTDTAAGRISPVGLAMALAMTGEVDQAVSLLEKAAEHKERQLLFLRVSPLFDRLRGNARFEALLKRIGVS